MAGGQQDVETPEVFFRAVERYLGIKFKYDMAADALNAKTDIFYTEENNALAIDWPTDGWIWLNPPFTGLTKWIAKCYDERLNGCKIVSIWPLSGDRNQIATWNTASIVIVHGRIWPKVRGCMLCTWDDSIEPSIKGADWDKKALATIWRG